MESKLLSFPKVNRIDKPALKDVLDGFVYVLEKVDGSQFRILIDPKTQTWDCGSKSVDGKENIDYKMFEVAIKRAEEVAQRYFENFDDPIVLYCEYLKEPKHNTLQYAHVPKNNLYLFAAYSLSKEDEIVPEGLEYIARKLEIDPPNVLDCGEFNVEDLEKFLDTKSYLGNELVEGIVLVNTSKLALPPYDALNWKKRAKLVRKEFQELNNQEWKQKKKPLETRFIETFVNENRLHKVINKLKESGAIKGEMSDLPLIFEEYWKDLLEEESDTIAQMTVDYFRRRGQKIITKWYKNIVKR